MQLKGDRAEHKQQQTMQLTFKLPTLVLFCAFVIPHLIYNGMKMIVSTTNYNNRRQEKVRRSYPLSFSVDCLGSKVLLGHCLKVSVRVEHQLHEGCGISPSCQSDFECKDFAHLRHHGMRTFDASNGRLQGTRSTSTN